MQISLEWLKDYIKLDSQVDKVSDLLTFSGIEVENIEIFGNLPDTIITAKIIESQWLEGSDHLQICQVDNGQETVQVVCGAPNCAAGSIVALALPGTKLGEITIKETKIRGVGSCGMLCSEKELGLSDNHSGILILPETTAIGINLSSALNLPDQIFELEITPNRPDLLGYHGIATDLGANLEIKVPALIADISKLEKADLSINSLLKLENQDFELCPRYLARVINNVRVAESPLWLKLRLLKSGFRPINNIVDITNYVMLETGHPLHAFDLDKLQGRSGQPEILVRRAAEGQDFPALDGNTYRLNAENLVIADGVKPIALAGVIGGLNSHITDSTVNIVVEAACFDHTSIRKTAYQHKISTDSAYRFERHLVPETCDIASQRAVQLILELAGGELCKGTLDSGVKVDKIRIVPIRASRFRKLIGISLSKEQIYKYLTNLGLSYLGEGCYIKQYPHSAEAIPQLVQDKDNLLYAEVTPHRGTQMKVVAPVEEALYFQIPPKRVDLSREADLIEEVIRLHGMNKVPQITKPNQIMDRHALQIRRKCADYFIYRGLHEVINLSFTDPGLIELLDLDPTDVRLNQMGLINPQNSNLSVMRTSLLPQLLITLLFNLNHEVSKISVFELNKVFLENQALPKNESYRFTAVILGSVNEPQWKFSNPGFDFYTIKGLVLDLLENLGLGELITSQDISGYFVKGESQSLIYNNELIAEYGKLRPAIAAKFGIDTHELKQDIWVADLNLDKVVKLTRNKNLTYHNIPRFPSVERDISFLIKTSINHAEILASINSAGGSSILDVVLADEYKGKQIPDGFRSLTYHMVLNHMEKTLTDDEVDTIVGNILNNLKSQWDIQLR